MITILVSRSNSSASQDARQKNLRSCYSCPSIDVYTNMMLKIFVTSYRNDWSAMTPSTSLLQESQLRVKVATFELELAQLSATETAVPFNNSISQYMID
mmetsp:Transcript_26945/g.47542  ORF Transcript_26945/g.47542 Transcript_26945/m.47542 type:complete len:99 (-) Transcript_26945:145-441(-)